jgi:hypothetical protein
MLFLFSKYFLKIFNVIWVLLLRCNDAGKFCSISFTHRWASFPQKATVTLFPFLAQNKIETVTSFSLPAPQKNLNGSIVLVMCNKK